MRGLARSFAVCIVAVCGLLTVAKADEEKVPLDRVPKAVLDAVKTRFPAAKLVGAEKETEAGKTVYEIVITNKEQKIEVTLTPEGKIIEIEKQIAAKDMPKVVADALQGKYPKATYKVIEEVFKAKDGKEKLAYYEAHLVTVQGKMLEVRVAADGKILGEEDQSKAKKEKK